MYEEFENYMIFFRVVLHNLLITLYYMPEDTSHVKTPGIVCTGLKQH